MANRFGKFFKNVLSGTMAALAPGSCVNAGLRVNREVLLLDDGGTPAIGTTIFIGRFRAGDVPDAFEIVSGGGAALAGVSFAIGTIQTPAKYSAAVAGPAAGATVRVQNTVQDGALEAVEDIYATTSVGALPAAAGNKIIFKSYYSHK